VGCGLKNRSVRLPADYSTVAIAVSLIGELINRDFMSGPVSNSGFIALGVNAAVHVDKNFAPLGKGVNHGHSNSVKAPGHFI